MASHGQNWFASDHRGAPGWLIVAAAVFLVACVALVAAKGSGSPRPAASANAASATPFVLATGAPETYVSILAAPPAFESTSWWADGIGANEITDAYADHVAVYPVRSSSGLEKRLSAVTRKTDYVVVQSGTNDLLAGRSPASTVAELRALWKGVRTDHAVPIAALVPPSDSLPAQVKALNARITAAAKKQHVTVLDVYSSVAAADGSWAKKFSADGTTPTTKAAKIMTKTSIVQLRKIVKTDS